MECLNYTVDGHQERRWKEEKDDNEIKSKRFLHVMNSDWAMDFNRFGDSKLRETETRMEIRVPESEDGYQICEFMKNQILQHKDNLLKSALPEPYSAPPSGVSNGI